MIILGLIYLRIRTKIEEIVTGGIETGTEIVIGTEIETGGIETETETDIETGTETEIETGETEIGTETEKRRGLISKSQQKR